MTAKILCELEVLHAAAHRDGGPAYEAYAATMFQVFPQLVKRIRELWGYLEKAQRKARQTEAALEEVQKERDEARAEVERMTEARDYDAKVTPDLLRELEEAKLLLSVKMETVEGMRQALAEKDSLLRERGVEVKRLREAAIQIRMGLIGMLLSDGLDAIDQKRRELFEITKGMVE